MRCCGSGQLVKGRAAVCGGGGKVVKAAIELGHVTLGCRSCGGMGGITAVILWTSIARLEEPNKSPLWEEARSPLSIALWRGID